MNVLLACARTPSPRLDAFKARIPNVLANYLRLPHLDRAAGRAAIVGPLERWNELASEDERRDRARARRGGSRRAAAGGRARRPGSGVARARSGRSRRRSCSSSSSGSGRLSGSEGSHDLRLETSRGSAARRRSSRASRTGARLARVPARRTSQRHLRASRDALRHQDRPPRPVTSPSTPHGADGSALCCATLARERILRASTRPAAAPGTRSSTTFSPTPVLAWRRAASRARAASGGPAPPSALAVAVASVAALAAVAGGGPLCSPRARSGPSRGRRDAPCPRARGARAARAPSPALPTASRLPCGAVAARAGRARRGLCLRQTLSKSRLRGSPPAAGPVADGSSSAAGGRAPARGRRQPP